VRLAINRTGRRLKVLVSVQDGRKVGVSSASMAARGFPSLSVECGAKAAGGPALAHLILNPHDTKFHITFLGPGRLLGGLFQFSGSGYSLLGCLSCFHYTLHP
jgi:hypothetical protein